MTVTTDVIAVATAGTPEQVVSDDAVRAAKMDIQADPSNTGNIYLGNSADMDPATLAGVIVVLGAGDSWAFDSGKDANRLQPSKLFVDADENDDKAIVSYWVA